MVDMLIRIKNGYLAKKDQVTVRWSKINEAVAKILVEKNFLKSLKVKDSELILTLAPGALTDVKIISKPSLRIYVKKNQLPQVLGGMGIAIISTPAGLLTDKDARAKGLGGEVLCEVW
ncbi:30S ribosomal protein S8 [Candidatus Microgenomates bacterium]|nr:30S ribosomal protein S8 [Candidatus Microgenomates bacterium]